MSERLLGAVVGMHGDDSGLIMPPSMAPIQVVLVPVAAHKSEAVMDTVRDVESTLKSAGIRVHVDDRDIRPGQKYYDWEIKGVPLRLDIGPRDVEKGHAFAARRTGGKQPIPLVTILESVNNELDEIQTVLKSSSTEHRNQIVKCVNSLDELTDEGHIFEVAFCGNDADAEVLEKTSNLTLLGEALEQFSEPRPCIVTGEMTTIRQHLARMY
jgi:prolyl-tRNA synthetase